MLAIAAKLIFTRLQLLLYAYFTNPCNCWQLNFTKMQLLLWAYFTNPCNCWQLNFTKMQLLLQAYFTNLGNCWWTLWNVLGYIRYNTLYITCLFWQFLYMHSI